MTRRNIAFNITLSGDRRRARGTVYTFQPLSSVRRALNFQVEFFFFNTRQQLQETRVKRVKRVRGDKRRRGSRHYYYNYNCIACTVCIYMLVRVYVSVIITITRTTLARTENKWPDKKAIGKILSYYVLLLLYSARICIYNTRAAHVVIKNDDVLHATPSPARIYSNNNNNHNNHRNNNKYASRACLYVIYPLNVRRPSNRSRRRDSLANFLAGCIHHTNVMRRLVYRFLIIVLERLLQQEV